MDNKLIHIINTGTDKEIFDYKESICHTFLYCEIGCPIYKALPKVTFLPPSCNDPKIIKYLRDYYIFKRRDDTIANLINDE